MYTRHPSARLNALFSAKPFQGVDPRRATFLFIGLDANYAPDIEHSPAFPRIEEYHEDGVSFWRRHGVHHPFLLPEYTGDGRHYHRSFSRIGFRAEHAALVSFVELLHLPTAGRSRLTPEDLSPAHLEWLNAAVLGGSAPHIFLPASVAALMRDSRAFDWLPAEPVDASGPLGVLHRRGPRTVYSHLHLSVYGKFQARKEQEAAAIRALIPGPAQQSS